MNRQELHKNRIFNTEKLREKRRWEEFDIRKRNREKLWNVKRMRREDFEEVVDDEFTVEEVQQFALQLQQNSSDRLLLLQNLRKTFSYGGVYIDAFLNNNNALTCLVGLLTGNDAQLQLEAAWCITNIAAGTHEHSMAVLKAASSYLITYLSSGNCLLQDQCAWAIGNIAGDSQEARDVLQKQGVIKPLIHLLQSSHSSVVQSAAFAISNLMRDQEFDTNEILKLDIIPLLLCHLDSNEMPCVIAEISWVLTYLAARLDNDEALVSHGCIERIVSLLTVLSDEQPHNSQVVTPLLRCLGNICSGLDSYSFQACQNPNLISSIGKYLNSDHRHIKKESLWVLSNMTAGNVHICQSVLQVGLIPQLVEMLTSTYDIRQEAIYCVCNLAFHGQEFCNLLLHLGALHGFIQMLKSADSYFIHLALKFIEMMLRTIPEACQKFEESNGVAFLEALEYHNLEEIQTQANQLLDTYFFQDKEESDVARDDEFVVYPPWRLAAQQTYTDQ